MDMPSNMMQCILVPCVAQNEHSNRNCYSCKLGRKKCEEEKKANNAPELEDDEITVIPENSNEDTVSNLGAKHHC
eukprot:12090100-Ditylum_brightwellii.AAC.1